jgi:hypothetical protein
MAKKNSTANGASRKNTQVFGRIPTSEGRAPKSDRVKPNDYADRVKNVQASFKPKLGTAH